MVFKNLTASALAIGVFIIALTIGSLIVTEVQTQSDPTDANDTLGHNVSQVGLSSIQDLVNWTPIVIVAIVGSLIIALIMTYMGLGGRQNA